ncbi:hypothetical protein LZC95_15985 [Pendulispora brunnea]|uniref:Bacterial Ig domain-containing protein n=1 Tax=Pendulispora brunnea TaxID=2905690 RepID=A0ABZ2KI12_9BACT
MARLSLQRIVRRFSAAFFALLVVLALVACASPTLPLPPPAIPSIAQTGEGQYRLRSEHGVEPNAIVVIINHNSTLSGDDRVDGTEADAQGTWEAVIPAHAGDFLDVKQEFGTMSSPLTTFQIPR